MNTKKVIVVISLILLLTAIILLPNVIESMPDDKFNPISESIDTQHLAVQACRLNDNACVYVSSYFGNVRIEVTPKNFPAFKPLSVAVDVKSPLLKGITVSLQGKDMFMGPNSISLSNLNAGEWGGSATIPVCSVDADMTWLLQLTLMGEQSETIVFEVKSVHL